MNPKALDYLNLEPHDQPSRNLEIYGANMMEFCTQPYLSRAWILQECVLAAELKLQCGSRQLWASTVWNVYMFWNRADYSSWRHADSIVADFRSSAALHVLQTRADSYNLTYTACSSLGIRSYEQLYSLSKYAPHRALGKCFHLFRPFLEMARCYLSYRIEHLVKQKAVDLQLSYYIPWLKNTGQNVGCSDARDRIYAAIAMMDPERSIIPDYDKSTENLFKEFVDCQINTNNFTCFYWEVHGLALLLELIDKDSQDRPETWPPIIRDRFFETPDFKDSIKTEDGFLAMLRHEFF